MLWIPITLLAALFQTGRNAAQLQLTSQLGTLGATQVRFVFGLPLAIVLLGVQALAYGRLPPLPNAEFVLPIVLGAVLQIAATAMLLLSMQARSFTLTVTYSKTEPVQVALFAWLFLGESQGVLGTIAILIATSGVILLSGRGNAVVTRRQMWMAALPGLASGAGFALSSVAFRAAILTLDDTAPLLLQATTTLVWSLFIQSLLLGAWMAVFQPSVLRATFRLWKPSLGAGSLGALASQCWFYAFALADVAQVRTLGLVEILFSQIAARRWLAQRPSRREQAGIMLVVVGVVLLLQQAFASP